MSWMMPTGDGDPSPRVQARERVLGVAPPRPPGWPCRSYPGFRWSRSILSAIAFDASPDQDEHSRNGGYLVGRRAPVVESCCVELTS